VISTWFYFRFQKRDERRNWTKKWWSPKPQAFFNFPEDFLFFLIFQFCFSLKISTFIPHCYDRNNRNYDFYKKARWYFWVSKYVVWRSLCWLTSENLISGIGKWTFLFRNLFLVSFKFLFWEIFWSTHYWRKMICKPIKQLRFETANNDINDAVFRMLGTDIIFLIILNLRNLEIWEHSSFFNY